MIRGSLIQRKNFVPVLDKTNEKKNKSNSRPPPKNISIPKNGNSSKKVK
jgi:hypothetical protein